ncbi:CyP450 monooxygenase [Dentipellis sp. KUC8613]|nr:CyP450 monooxygenase [Dentipellis sp. KUC8613]
MSFSATQYLALSLLVGVWVTVYYYVQRRRRNPSGLPYPPGPKGLPILGNLLDLPREGYVYKAFRQWGRDLGSDIVHVEVLGTHIIVLNTKEVADDLLDKRSSIYSDRPRMPMMNELMGFYWSVGFTPYNEWWKHSRRLFHQYFQPSAVVRFQPKKLRATHNFLRRLADSPEDFRDHVRLMAGSVIMDIAYGLDIQSAADPYLQRADEALHIIDKAGNPGSWLVDVIPSLKYVPEWMPGAGFKRKAREWRAFVDRFTAIPFEAVKDAMQAGTAVPSFSSLALRDIKAEDEAERKYQEELIKGVAATTYTAGADTTMSVIATFFLAMTMFPDVQRKAHEELDRVVGTDRLPDFGDEPNLPYISAIMKEVLRWQQVAPFAIPHRVMADDVYNGYFIPAGSIVIGNSWAVLHDENLYPDPFTFKPERFLGPDVSPRALVAVDHAFGFGRRLCPGRFMAMSFAWITMASTLAAFRVDKAVDAQGKVIEPAGAFSPGIMGTPELFPCSIKPRSKEAEHLVRHTA